MRRRRRRCPRPAGIRRGRAPSLPRDPRGWLPDTWSTWLLVLVHAIEQRCRIWKRALLRPSHRGVYFLQNLRLLLIQFRPGGPAFGEHFGLQAGDRVELGPRFEQFLGYVLRAIVRGMARHTGGLALQQ